MLSLKEIKKFYPHWPGRERSILREYLQYKILDVIFKSRWGRKLVFVGGTAIRICYAGNRFSEDLDFDNFGLKKEEFAKMTELIKRELEAEGYQVEYRNVYKGAYHSYFKFKEILYSPGLSSLKGEKIMIEIDTVQEEAGYQPKIFVLSKFDVARTIRVAPASIILDKKVGAILGRRTAKGRDFYDVVFLKGETDFDYDYLKRKWGIDSSPELKRGLFQKIKGLDFKKLARDVEPFLINPQEKSRVEHFKEYINQEL